MINFLENTPKSKFTTINSIEVNDNSYGANIIGSQIKCKTMMLNSSLCDYNDAYILVEGTTTVTKSSRWYIRNDTNKKVIIKNYAPFTDCISKMNKTLVYNDKDSDVIMAMYNLLGCSNKYLNKSGTLP